jgi:hypothetical protein
MLRLRHPLSLLVIFGLVLLGVMRSYSTPAPVDAGAPDVVFSADRADAILLDLLADAKPHVAGSPANAAVRDRVIGHLQAAGYEPELQSRFHCNPVFGTCSWVDNIIAVRPGAVGKHAVLLTSHYDSAWAGPGAADSGAGTAAVLEIARMASNFPAWDNDVIFLLTDSEENGLIGAHAFAEHHPLFAKVRAVINLEARGVTGPSAMFETGAGNRSVIRMLSKSVARPVANSLTYEIYRRMPNDTDYSVYKGKGIMGVNFAFVSGVALYHSARDDVDHLDRGSLQHHGDNAWGMLQAFGERDLATVQHREDAGYVDLFGTRLSHYPVSIAGGLALVLGVWVMLAITLAFRKEFRYRQLRWGLVAIPLMLAAIAAAGYLLSWPLGRVPELHPLEHPLPWAGRLALWLSLVLVLYATVKLFSGRVSACAWMILGWASFFVVALLLANRMPSAAHIVLLPLAGFALGSVIDLFRKKSPAPLLVASLLGYAAAVFVSLYYSLMTDVVMNFDRSVIKILPLTLAAIAVMPMLLAWARGRELTWQPARWLLVALLAICSLHLFLPGFTAERPRDMTLMYREVAGADSGQIVLESVNRQPDLDYARGHGFETAALNDGRFGTTERPARTVAALELPGVELLAANAVSEGGAVRQTLELQTPPGIRLLLLTLPPAAGLQKAWVDGVLALDTSLETKRQRKSTSVAVVYPGAQPLRIELLLADAAATRLAALTWHALPGVLTAPFMGNWPDDAQPAFYGPRAEKIQEFDLASPLASP